MFTKRAVGFLLLAVFLFFLGGATNVGWVRIVDAVLWGMLGLSLLLQWLSVATVEARLRLVKTEHSDGPVSPMEDDVVEVELELVNRRFWPRFFVSAAYEASFESPGSLSQRLFVASLSGHGTVKLASKMECHRRGLHFFGPVTIESQAPFGLFRRRRRVQAPFSLLVYPKVYPLDRLALAEGATGPSERSRRARTGQEIVGSRPYTGGDSLRHIHWRNTAKLRRLVVKEMEDTSDRSVTIAFDVRRSIGQGRETTLEYSIKLAAAVGVHVLKLGEPVRLAAGRLYGEWTEPEPFLRELATLTPSDAPTLSELLQSVPTHSTVVTVSTAVDRDTAQALEYTVTRVPSLAAIVLEGFDESDEPAGLAARLKGAGIRTVVCRRGRLTEAIDALEQVGLPPAPTVDANVPSTVGRV